MSQAKTFDASVSRLCFTCNDDDYYIADEDDRVGGAIQVLLVLPEHVEGDIEFLPVLQATEVLRTNVQFKRFNS